MQDNKHGNASLCKDLSIRLFYEHTKPRRYWFLAANFYFVVTATHELPLCRLPHLPGHCCQLPIF